MATLCAVSLGSARTACFLKLTDALPQGLGLGAAPGGAQGASSIGTRERDQEMAQTRERVERMELQQRLAERLQAERMALQQAAETDRLDLLRAAGGTADRRRRNSRGSRTQGLIFIRVSFIMV